MYQTLFDAIEHVKIIDDHCHVGSGYLAEHPESSVGALPLFPDLFTLPKDSKTGGFDYQRELHYEAYERLYGFTREQLDDPARFGELKAAYDARRQDIAALVDQVTQAAGVEYVIGNAALPRELLGRPNVGFIPSVDALVYPFDNAALARRRGTEHYLDAFQRQLSAWKGPFGWEDGSFAGYLAFADRVLAGLKRQGALGYKLLSSYIRSTYFAKEDPGRMEEDFLRAKEGDQEAYHRFQNAVVWRIMEYAAEARMPVQVHMALVDGDIDALNPLNFQVFLRDQRTADAQIVLLHGCYPRYDDAATVALAAKPRCVNNIYIDISGRIMFSGHPKVLADMLGRWLVHPALWGKILYGSDMLYGERSLYTCAKTGRRAVYLALEKLIDDGIVGEDAAVEIARGILRNNAIRLYQLPFAPA